jgi:hypothetical protein
MTATDGIATPIDPMAASTTVLAANHKTARCNRRAWGIRVCKARPERPTRRPNTVAMTGVVDGSQKMTDNVVVRDPKLRRVYAKVASTRL